MQPTVSGTMAAMVPMLVPTISRVSGMMATSSMMKGTERPTLTMMPRVLFNSGLVMI